MSLVFEYKSEVLTWECLETQWRRTLRTRMVAAVEIMDSCRDGRSLKEERRPSPPTENLPRGGVLGMSLGLLDPAVATAKAAAAEALLLL